MFDDLKMGVFCEECIILSHGGLWNQLRVEFLVDTYDKLPCFVDLLSSYIHVFNFSNVISEMAVKRQSPAQRGARISNRIFLDLDEDGQKLKRGRLSPQSFDSIRYFCCISFQ